MSVRMLKRLPFSVWSFDENPSLARTLRTLPPRRREPALAFADFKSLLASDQHHSPVNRKALPPR